MKQTKYLWTLTLFLCLSMALSVVTTVIGDLDGDRAVGPGDLSIIRNLEDGVSRNCIPNPDCMTYLDLNGDNVPDFNSDYLGSEMSGNPLVYACSDNLDNDGDGLFDLTDPGCITSVDNDEDNLVPSIDITSGIPCVFSALDKNNDNVMDGDLDGDGSIGPGDLNLYKSYVEYGILDTVCYRPVCDSNNVIVNTEKADSCGDLIVLSYPYNTVMSNPKCSNGIDDDNDGLIDLADTLGCTDANDNDETDPLVPEVVTPTPPSSEGPSGRCRDVTEEGKWGPCLDANGAGKRYRTDLVYKCGNKFNAEKVTIFEACELSAEESTTESGTESEVTQDSAGIDDITGQVVTDVEGSNGTIYWLIALGIVILVAGGILYTRETKK